MFCLFIPQSLVGTMNQFRGGMFNDCEKFRYTENISFYYAPQDKDDKIYIHEIYDKTIGGKKVPHYQITIFEESKWNDYKLHPDYRKFQGMLEKAHWFKTQVDNGTYKQIASQVN